MTSYLGLINIDAAAGTSGTSDSTKALQSATTTVNVSAATAPTNGQVLTAISGTAATWQTPSGGGSSTQGTLLNLSDTTQSTSKDTGALVVEGGVGVEKNLYVGGNLVVTGTSPGGAEFTATDQTGNYTASSGDWVVYALTSAGATLTLPATPSQGDAVRVSLKSEATNEVAHYVAIARNGSSIDGGTAAEFETYNILWKSGDTVTFRCVASGEWVTSERRIRNRFVCRAGLDTNQSITQNSMTVIQYDSIRYDFNNNFDETTNYNYTIPITGVYAINYQFYMAGLVTDKRALTQVYKNGSTIVGRFNAVSQLTAADFMLNTTITEQFTAGDTVQIRVEQRDTTSRNILDASNDQSETFVTFALIARS